jgi:hypothetical protein
MVRKFPCQLCLNSLLSRVTGEVDYGSGRDSGRRERGFGRQRLKELAGDIHSGSSGLQFAR